MSREDHRKHDAELERSRRLEAEAKSESMRLTPKEWTVLVIGTFLGVAGVRSEDLFIVTPCLMGCWLAFLLICLSHKWATIWRVITSLGITCVFIALMTRIYSRRLQEAQDDVYQHLSVRIELPATGDVMNGFFVLSNGSKARIAEDASCVIHAIVGTRGALAGFTSIGLPSGGSLGPGGEAQSFQCLKPAYPYIVGTVLCADVELLVHYSLESQAAIKKERYFRFAGYRDADQFIFVPQPSSGATNNEPNGSQYCGKYLPRPHPAPSP
jgi:hypothetical protein